jgi:hypothetical protein
MVIDGQLSREVRFGGPAAWCVDGPTHGLDVGLRLRPTGAGERHERFNRTSTDGTGVAVKEVFGIVNMDARAAGAGVDRLVAAPKPGRRDLECIAGSRKDGGTETHSEPS